MLTPLLLSALVACLAVVVAQRWPAPSARTAEVDEWEGMRRALADMGPEPHDANAPRARLRARRIPRSSR